MVLTTTAFKIKITNIQCINKFIRSISTNIFLADFRISFIESIIDYHRFSFNCRRYFYFGREDVKVGIALCSRRSLIYAVLL